MVLNTQFLYSFQKVTTRVFDFCKIALNVLHAFKLHACNKNIPIHFVSFTQWRVQYLRNPGVSQVKAGSQSESLAVQSATRDPEQDTAESPTTDPPTTTPELDPSSIAST